jgi:hypothetical protein
MYYIGIVNNNSAMQLNPTHSLPYKLHITLVLVRILLTIMLHTGTHVHVHTHALPAGAHACPASSWFKVAYPFERGAGALCKRHEGAHLQVREFVYVSM